MRISDWSSDVCSSDLALGGGAQPGAAAGGGGLLMMGAGLHFALRPSHGEKALASFEAELAASPESRALAVARSEERRVGKDVSVRVDLGGRRIIKKKKMKTPCPSALYHDNHKT